MSYTKEQMRDYMRNRRGKEKQARPDSWKDGRVKYATEEERADAKKRSIAQSYRLWKTTNRKKLRAQWRLSKAVLRGTVDKPDVCSSCGKGGIIHGHHPDYDKPLEVIWLCPGCHKAVHFNTLDPTTAT